eukprot:9468509-Pyramimonas_sp.AAC.1
MSEMSSRERWRLPHMGMSDTQLVSWRVVLQRILRGLVGSLGLLRIPWPPLRPSSAQSSQSSSNSSTAHLRFVSNLWRRQ